MQQLQTTPALAITSESKQSIAGLSRGVILGNAVNDARRVAATPPNICNPPWMAKEAKKIAKKTGLKCKIITYAEAIELGLQGIVNVGKDFSAQPKLSGDMLQYQVTAQHCQYFFLSRCFNI